MKEAAFTEAGQVDLFVRLILANRPLNHEGPRRRGHAACRDRRRLGRKLAAALGVMGQEEADRAVAMVQQIGNGVALIVGTLGVLLPIVSALFAGRSASPTAQIRKVESLPDVTVVPITPKGDELVEKAKK